MTRRGSTFGGLVRIAAITTALFVAAFAVSFAVSGAMNLAIADGHTTNHSAPEGEP